MFVCFNLPFIEFHVVSIDGGTINRRLQNYKER